MIQSGQLVQSDGAGKETQADLAVDLDLGLNLEHVVILNGTANPNWPGGTLPRVAAATCSNASANRRRLPTLIIKTCAGTRISGAHRAILQAEGYGFESR